MPIELLTSILFALGLTCSIVKQEYFKSQGFKWLGLAGILWGIVGTAHAESMASADAAGAIFFLSAVVLAQHSQLSKRVLLVATVVVLTVVAVSVVLDDTNVKRWPTRVSYEANHIHRPHGIDYSPIFAGEDGLMLTFLALTICQLDPKLTKLGAPLSVIGVVSSLLTITRSCEVGLSVGFILGLWAAVRKKDRATMWLIGVDIAAFASVFLIHLGLGTRNSLALAGDPSVIVRVKSWENLPAVLRRFPLGGAEANHAVLAKYFDGWGALSFPGQFALIGGIPLACVAFGIYWRAVYNYIRDFRLKSSSVPLVRIAGISVLIAELFAEPFTDLWHSLPLWAVIALAMVRE